MLQNTEITTIKPKQVHHGSKYIYCTKNQHNFYCTNLYRLLIFLEPVVLTLEGVLRRAALPAGNGGGASWWALQGGSRQELRCEEETAGGRSQGGEAAAQMQYEERGRAGGDRGWKGKSVAFPEKRVSRKARLEPRFKTPW